MVSWEADDGGVLFVRSMVSTLFLEQAKIVGLPLLPLVVLFAKNT